MIKPSRLKIGDKVKVVQKKDYKTGRLIKGVIKEILTKKEYHPRGIKVRLTNGVIGRVQEVVEVSPQETKRKGEIENYFKDPGALI